MTKQDYIALAEAIQTVMHSNEPYANPTSIKEGTLECVAGKIANVLARDNSRFDRERFLAAALKGEWSNAPGHANTRNGKR